MKREKSAGGLFGLLARQYLLFTLALFAIAAAVFALWVIYTARLYWVPDWDSLLADPALTAGKWETLRGYLTPDSGFAVYDEDGARVFAAGEGFDERVEPGALDCVPVWGAGVQIDAYELSGDGAARYLVVSHTPDGEGGEATRTVVLDGNYRMLLGGLEEGRTAYTPEEYRYLTGARFANSFAARANVSGPEGRAFTLLLRETYPTDAQYSEALGSSVWVAALFLPLFLLAAGLFIWRLRRRIARPLAALNAAVDAQSRGEDLRVGNCGGPREIRRIGQSFDQFAQRLAESEAERKRLDEGRQKLIADISHDIKTPVTVICGAADALCDGKVPEEERDRTLRMIQQKAADLARLTDAFHEYSKTQHPRFELQLRRVDVCEFLRAWLARRYDEIDLAGFSLELVIPETPAFCMVDELQLRRALDNLLSNALRHNRLGTLLFVEAEPGPQKITVRIADNGAGIPPERRKTIFEPFVTGSDARTGTGSGLGLAITRRILEKHGGSIRLNEKPAPGRSTEFVLTLPLAREE